MNRPHLFVSILVVFATISLSTQRSHADIAMTAREVGDNVVFSFSGSIDLTGLGILLTSTSRGSVYPINSFIEFGPGAQVTDATNLFTSSVATSPENIGTGSFQAATSSTGSYFSVNKNSFKVPLGYVSGSQISGSVTFIGKSLADLGVESSDTPTWELTNGQQITLSFLDAVAAPAMGDSKVKTALEKKVKKLNRQIKKAQKKKQIASLKKFKKQLKALKAKLRAL